MSRSNGRAQGLVGKVAIITGGTRGFGLAMARAFVREGVAVVVASRSVESVQRAVAELRQPGGRVEGVVVDVADHLQVERLAEGAIETFGGFDIWINNAGQTAPYGPSGHVPPPDFTEVTRTIVFGVYNGSQVALRHFLPRASGKLINVLGWGDRRPVPYQNAYASGKAWVRSFTLALAEEYRESGVGIHAINPGMMRTDLLQRIRVVAGHEARLRRMAMVVSMWGSQPTLPAERAVWLASSSTDGRTGLYLQEMSLPKMVVGAAREGMRRVLGFGFSARVEVKSIPSALVPLLAKSERDPANGGDLDRTGGSEVT